MNSTNIKLAIGGALFATWVALVICKVPGADDLISNIKLALGALGGYHIADRSSVATAP